VQISVYDLEGKVTRQIEVSDDVFAVPFNEALVHQAMLRQLANARQGTASTKTRGQVAGSTRKLFRQKGTGSARAGSIKSPLRPGGGIVFGPHPRDYRQEMPKKMRQMAIRCLLSAKARDGELKVMEDIKLEAPKTKEMVKLLGALGAQSSTLIAMSPPEGNIILSARNLAHVKTTPANLLNVGDILSYKVLLMTESAVRMAEQLWGREVRGGDSASV
jgi:large subunit ribosomal protein L4